MSYCRLCGSPDFLVNISDHQNHLEYLHLIDYHLSVKLPAADSHCLVCATCVAQITYLRQWKRKILNHQSLLSTNHEPPSVCSDNDTSVAQSTPPEHLFYNSQHEEFNPSILVAESLAHGVDPLSVSSIKRERVDPAESNINTSHSSIDQIEIEEHPLLARVKQEPCTPPSLVPRHNDRYHSTCSTVPGTDSRYDVSSQNKAVVLSAASRSFDFQTLVHSDCADSQLNSTDDASARVVTLDEPPGGGAVSRSGKYSEQIIQDATQTKNSKNLLIECYKCGHVVIAKDDMDTHWLDVHNVNLRTTQSRRISRYQSKQLYYRYVCTICEKKFDSYNGARTHRKVHRPDGTLYSEDGALYDANEDNETSGDEVTIDVDERLNNLDENLIEALSKVEDLFSKREASEGIPSRGSHADETNSALTSDVKNSSQNERTDQKRTEACSAELQPLDDKARVKFDILRNELFDTHFQHVSERPSFRLGRKHDITNSKSNTIPHDKTDGELDVNVKIETLDTLVKRWSKSELATSKTELVASEEIVRACYRRQWNTVQENSNDRTGNDSLNDSSELEDSKVSLLSVIVKTENVHNDALEENSDYKDMSNMNNNNNNSNTVMNSNKSRADHFLGFASSENCTRSASCTNNAENSLGDDQHTFSSNKVDGSPEVKDAQVPEVKDNYQCNLCNVYFDTIPLLGEHMKSHTFEVMKSNYLKGLNTHTEVMCELCSTVVNVIRFKQHLKIVHSHADYPIPDALVIPTGGVRCCICKEEFKRTAMYESHRKTCYIESMIMRQLKRVANQMNSENSKNILEIELKQTPHQARNGSDSKRDLKKPLNQYDVQQTRRSADATGNREEKLISSENTKIKKRGSNKYDCAKCGLACETKLGFDIHRIFHGSPHTRGNFSCLECNVTWTSVTAARNHLKRQHLHVENSVTLCAHCLQTFPDKNRYNGHFKKMMVQPALTKNGKSSESEDEETPSDESEDEADKNDSAELMDTLKKNLGLELSQAIASAVETSTPGRTEASPTTKRLSKELKMLSINANFTPAEWSEDKRPRRREVESSDVTMSSRHSGSSSSNSNLTTRSNSPVLLSDKIKNVQFQELKEKIRAAMIAVKSAKASEEKKDKPEAEARGGGQTNKHSSDSSRTGEHRTEGELMNNSDEFYFDHKGHPRKIFTCPRCSMRFITELVYEDHVEKCGKDMFKSNKNGGVCSLCNIYFTELRKHNVVHGNANHRFHTQEKYIYVYQCPICLADSKQDIGRFNRHLEECKAKGAGHMKCKHCKRLCSNLSNKMRHQIACSAQLARAMFRKAKTPLLKCTYCCRHIQQTREAHDKICLKPIVGYATPTTSKPEKRKRAVPHNVKIVVVSALSPNTTQVTPPVVPDQTNVDQDDSDTETINKCDKCDKTFPLRIAYKKHISKCTGAAKESPSEQVSTTAKALPSENESTGNQSSGAVSACLSCFLCDHSNETSVHLFNHYTRKHHLNIEVSGPPSRRQYKCLYCHKQCNSFMKFNLHGHFHEKQKNSLNKKEKKEKESFQTETTSERQKSVTPTVTNTTEPMKTRDKSKASVEKQPDFTSKKGSTENSQSSPRGSESALITRSGTVVSRAHVEDSNTSVTTPTTRNRSIMSPARASTSSSSQSQSRDSNSSDSPNTKERKWKSLTENAKIMNSYKKTKPQHKKSTKCESCKEYIRNTCYTQHAVKCVSSSIRNPKRTKNDIIMSGYVKKKNKAPRMMCIHCKLYISGRKFATHLSKCERKSSYRNIQRTSDVGKEKIPANESQVRPNTRHNEASGSKHTEIMAPRPSFKKIEIINLEPIVNTRRNETDALKSKTIEVMLSKPSLKNVEIIPLKSPSRKIEVPQPVKKKLEGFPPKLSPTVPITKKPESTVYKPAQRKVEITPVTSPRNKLDVSPKNSSCINESPSKAIKVIEVNYTKPGSKHVVVPPPTVVVPSPRDTSPRIRKSRNSIEPSKVFCPLCSTRTEIHKENVSSHYNYYHKQELSLSMYLEVLGLKPDNTQCFIQTSTMYCPLCEKTYEKSEMRNHYRYHRRDLNYSLFIEVLGFRNETDFVDFIENNENRLTRVTRRSKTAPVEIIDLEQQNVEKSPQERRKKSLENVAVVAPQANTSKGTLTLASETRSSRRTRGHPEPEPIKPSEIEEKRITRKRDRSKQLDENLSLADLLDIKRRRENPTNTDTRPSRPVRNRNIVETSDPIVLNETPTSTNTRPNRPIRTRNILETSDPIILNEDDAGELSDAAEDDPLADPFGGCGDQADMVDKPIDRSDEESMGGMNEIAVLEDWGSLEKKTTEEKEEGEDMSKDELEKKRQLQEKIKNQLQKKIDAILNKNIAEAEARKKQLAASKTKIPSPAAVPKPKTMTPSPTAVPRPKTMTPSPTTAHPRPKLLLPSLTPNTMTPFPTAVPKPKIMTPSPTAVSKPKTILIPTPQLYKEALSNAMHKKGAHSIVKEPVVKNVVSKTPVARPENVTSKTLVNIRPLSRSEMNPGKVTSSPNTEQKDTPSAKTEQKTTTPNPLQKKTEKMKNKLLLKFKKETSQNSYTVSQKQGNSSDHQKKIPLNKPTQFKPKNRDMSIGHMIANTHSDKNVINKLRGIKIQRKTDDQRGGPSVLSNKVESISKQNTGQLDKSDTSERLAHSSPFMKQNIEQRQRNESSEKLTHSSPSVASVGNISSNSNGGPQNICEQPPQNESEHKTEPSSSDMPSRPTNETNSEPNKHVTFVSTFVTSSSPPPSQSQETVPPSEPNSIPSEPASGQLLEAPGSPLFPPPPSNLVGMTSQPARLAATPSPSPENTPSKYPASSVLSNSPDSPPMFPSVKTVVSASQHRPSTPAAASCSYPQQMSYQSQFESSQQQVLSPHSGKTSTFEAKQGGSQSTPPVRFSSPSPQPSSHVSHSPSMISQHYAQPQQHHSVQYSSTHGSPYVECPPVTTTPISYPVSTSAYVEYPKPVASFRYAVHSSPVISRSNTPVHQSSPPSPMVKPIMSPAPAAGYYDNPPTPSSPMNNSPSPHSSMMHSPKSYTDLTSSGQAYSSSSHVKPPVSTSGPAYSSSSHIKLPPVSTIVQHHRNTSSPYSQYPSTQDGGYPSQQSTLTDNLLSIPPTKRRTTEYRSTPSPSPNYSSSYLPTSSPTASVSPNYAHLSTAYPISSVSPAPAQKKTSTANTPVPTSHYPSYEAPASNRHTVSHLSETHQSSPLPSYTSSTFPCYDAPSAKPYSPYEGPASNLISYPIAGASHAPPSGYPYSAYPPAPPSYLPPLSQGFRPYETAYPLAYDYQGTPYGHHPEYTAQPQPQPSPYHPPDTH